MKGTRLSICGNKPLTRVHTCSKIEGPIGTTRNKGALLLFSATAVKHAVIDGKHRERTGSSTLMEIHTLETIMLILLRLLGSLTCNELSNFESYSMFVVFVS